MARRRIDDVIKVDGRSLASQMAAALQSMPEGGHIELPDEDVPSEIDRWLQKLGWERTERTYPHEFVMYSKPNRFDSLYMTWSEAVSCEFFAFLTLGVVGEEKPSQNMGDTVAGASAG